MRLREYWKRRALLAWHGTLAFANSWQWVFGAPPVLAFAATYFVKPEDGVIIAHHPGWDAFVVAFLAFLVTAVVAYGWRFVVVAPYQMYSALVAERDALAERLKPTLRVEFDDKPDCVREFTLQNGVLEKRFRIRVTSSTHTACQARLTQVLRDNLSAGWVDSVHLRWTPAEKNEEVKILHSGITEYIDVGSCYENPRHEHMFQLHCFENPPYLPEFFNASAHYQLHIEVASDGSSNGTIDLTLHKTGQRGSTTVKCLAANS